MLDRIGPVAYNDMGGYSESAPLLGLGISSTMGQLRSITKIVIGLLIVASLVSAWHTVSRYAVNYDKTHLHIGEPLQQVAFRAGLAYQVYGPPAKKSPPPELGEGGVRA